MNETSLPIASSKLPWVSSLPCSSAGALAARRGWACTRRSKAVQSRFELTKQREDVVCCCLQLVACGRGRRPPRPIEDAHAHPCGPIEDAHAQHCTKARKCPDSTDQHRASGSCTKRRKCPDSTPTQRQPSTRGVRHEEPIHPHRRRRRRHRRRRQARRRAAAPRQARREHRRARHEGGEAT